MSRSPRHSDPDADRQRRGQALPASYRWFVASRCTAAIVGGFALTSTLAWLLAALLLRTGAMPRAEATATATLASFAVWATVIVWAFHAASLRRLWLQVTLPPALMGGLAWWLARSS